MMMSIRIPQAIALDTAILGIWARDWACGNPRARRLVEALARSNVRLLVTIHHTLELAGHASDDVVGGRARFVRALGQLFWVRGRAYGGVGSLLDLHASEIRARVADGDASYPQIVSRARPDVLAFGDSEGIAELLEEPTFRAYARNRIRRRRIVASVARTKVSVPTVTQQRVHSERCRVPVATILRNFESEQRHFASQLKRVGDRRLVEHDRIAEQFFDELRRDVQGAEVNGGVILADALRRLGIADIDLARPVSADELADIYVRKRQSEILARIANVPASVVEALRPAEIPSLNLCTEISASHQRSHRAEGGDFNDASLSCLSLYARVTSVDKRTAEYIRQIRKRSPELGDVMGQVVRLSSLEGLELSMPLWEGYDPD